jgi:hypothetical protein
LLASRDGVATSVTLKSGRTLIVHNFAWGYDHAHVTTNISPAVVGATTDFFFTNEIGSISDSASGQPLG